MGGGRGKGRNGKIWEGAKDRGEKRVGTGGGAGGGRVVREEGAIGKGGKGGMRVLWTVISTTQTNCMPNTTAHLDGLVDAVPGLHQLGVCLTKVGHHHVNQLGKEALLRGGRWGEGGRKRRDSREGDEGGRDKNGGLA